MNDWTQKTGANIVAPASSGLVGSLPSDISD